MITLENVTKKIDKNTILDNISFEIPTGSCFALIGSNGAGKSTILRLISGIYKEESGKILIDNKTVFDNPSSKEKVFFINDETIQFQQFTVDSLKDYYMQFYPKFSEETFEKLLKKVNLPKDKKLSTFSKGMKRQAIVIVGIASGSDYLLLDESFDGLDPTMRLIVKHMLFDAMEERDLTVVISSHNLKEITELCDNCALIHEGKLIFRRDIEGVASDLFKVQVAFKDNEDINSIKSNNEINIVHMDKNMSVYNLIIRGDRERTEEIIKEKNPVIMDFMPLTLEETFIYEMEGMGYADFNL
jgi:ABC-2 type transport system ATP-binding protein